MSNRERAVAMIDSFTDDQLGNGIVILQTMKQAIEDARIPNTPNADTVRAIQELESGGGNLWTGSTAETPNAETVAALLEGDEMIRTGKGQRFQGTTEEFFAMLDAEDAADAEPERSVPV